MMARLSLAEMAARWGGQIHGDEKIEIVGVASPSSAGREHIILCEARKHLPAVAQSQAGAVIIDEHLVAEDNRPRWVVASPRLIFARVAQFLHPSPTPSAGIAEGAVVSSTATVAETAAVEAGAVIRAGAIIADDCFIAAHAVIGERAIIGRHSRICSGAVIGAGVKVGCHCLIHSGAVIGADGFGFVADEQGVLQKMPQLGGVVLGDYVDVGANSAIDRGTLDPTVIKNGVKIDNLVQIGHNVHIGENTVVCGCVGVAGSVHIGAHCLIGGAAGIAGHVAIGDGARVAARATVTRNVAAGDTVSSVFPAMPIAQWRRFAAGLRRQFLGGKDAASFFSNNQEGK